MLLEEDNAHEKDRVPMSYNWNKEMLQYKLCVFFVYFVYLNCKYRDGINDFFNSITVISTYWAISLRNSWLSITFSSLIIFRDSESIF